MGRAVIDLALAQGHSVVSIDRVQPAEGSLADNVTFIQASITDYADFENAISGCDALVHLAAFPSPGGRPDYEACVTTTWLAAATRLALRRVWASSGSARHPASTPPARSIAAGRTTTISRSTKLHPTYN